MRLRTAIYTIVLTAVFFGVLATPLFAALDDERVVLEQELADLELEIAKQEATIYQLKTEGKSLQSEINRYNANIEKINLQIRSVTYKLSSLTKEIGTKEVQIKDTKEQIDFNKEALASALQAVYETGHTGLIEVLLRSPQLSDFFGDINNLLDIQDSLVLTIDQIIQLKDNLVDQKEVLALQRDDAAALKKYQASQKAGVEQNKKEKATLLTVTKGKEAIFQKQLVETKKSAAEIRSRIFRLLGGGQLTFEEAYQFAKLAESSTGVRAALVLAVLDQESALGRNVGGCPYYNTETGRYYMHPTRDVPPFLEITKELGLDPLSMKVSCPNSDGAYGGAMGPAQFIPSTWQLYKKGIQKITGSNPASPWRNADAFVATALYLSDSLGSSGCRNYATKYQHILPKTFLQERCAAAKYYAGGRWFTYRFAYGDPVLRRADRFQDDIDILTS